MRVGFYYLATLWIMLWVQVVSNHYLGGTPFAVQWILIATLHFGLARGPWAGEWIGFGWGLLVDAASLGLLGIHAILYALAGYAAGMLRRQLDSSKVSTQAVFSWMITLIYFVLYMIVERFFSVNEGPFQWALITVPLMNAALAPLIFLALERWAVLWGMEPVER